MNFKETDCRLWCTLKDVSQNENVLYCPFFRREVHATKKVTEKRKHINGHILRGNINYNNVII